MLRIIEKTKIWFTLSLAVILVGMIFLGIKGMNFGIDFTGGTVVTVNIGKDYNMQELRGIAEKHASDAVVRTAGENNVEIQSNQLDDAKIKALSDEIKTKYAIDNAAFSQNTKGETIGIEMARSSILALIVANILMVLYIRFRFKDFNFGLAAVAALIHDVLITLGVYAIFQIPVNSSFIAATLTIMGYSINDTIVIFDRIRENLNLMRGKSYQEIADTSITQTLRRSLNTGVTTLFTIIAVYIFVPPVRDLAFPLLFGIVVGSYSSIFIASPLWVLLKNAKKKRKNAIAA
jgi:preprotein translocase subunit SecF